MHANQPRVVIDTPVFDRALQNASSADARVLDAWRTGNLRAVLSPEMIDDVRGVLRSADNETSTAYLNALRDNTDAVGRNEGAAGIKSDLEETPALAVLVASGAECLVTSDPGLLSMSDQYNVLSPEDFLQELS